MDQDWNNFWCFEAQEAREGIIVSNDNLRDFINENEAFKDAIENRLLNYKIVSHKDKTEFLIQEVNMDQDWNNSWFFLK